MITMDQLAEASAKHTALRAQYGEPGFRPHFLAYLQTKGFDERAFAEGNNAWQARFKADPSGQLEAEYSMKLSRAVAAAHYGDVRDMSGDTQEGVTLDRYAQITVAMGKPNADHLGVARAHGLNDMEHWQRVNQAWTAAMKADTSHKLSMQYSQLYQKHAGPEFEQKMRDQIAAQNVAAQQRRRDPEPPPRELTVPELIEQLKAPDFIKRYRAARELAHKWDVGHRADPSLSAALACVPVLIEVVERHDDGQTSEAEDAARKLMDLEQRNDEVKSAFARCANRAREHLATLKTAFAPIQNQAVPERLPLQMKIQGYESLIQTLDGYLSDWPSAAPVVAPAGGRTAASSSSQSSAAGAALNVVVRPNVGGIAGLIQMLIRLIRGLFGGAAR